MKREPTRMQQYMTRMVNVELTVAELTRLQICLFERIEMQKSRLLDEALPPEQREELMVDAVNAAADLKLLTEKALAT